MLLFIFCSKVRTIKISMSEPDLIYQYLFYSIIRICISLYRGNCLINYIDSSNIFPVAFLRMKTADFTWYVTYLGGRLHTKWTYTILYGNKLQSAVPRTYVHRQLIQKEDRPWQFFVYCSLIEQLVSKMISHMNKMIYEQLDNSSRFYAFQVSIVSVRIFIIYFFVSKSDDVVDFKEIQTSDWCNPGTLKCFLCLCSLVR